MLPRLRTARNGRLASARLPVVLFAGLSVAGCGEATAPDASDVDGPTFAYEGTRPAVSGLGTLGSGAATAGSDRQEFDFVAAADLEGRLFYHDWTIDANLVVDDDPETRFTAYRDGSSLCANPEFGAEVDGLARLSTGGTATFTLVACDDEAAGGTDGMALSTTTGYRKSGLVTSGDIVKWIEGAPPTTGELAIVTETTGEDLPAGYRFRATGQGVDAADTIGVHAGRTLPELPPGDYAVELLDVPSNCTVSGSNPSDVTVVAGGTATVSFSVSCTAVAPPAGDLTVTTSTSGSSQPSSYTVSVDGGSSRSIGASASVTYPDLAAGSHTVALTSVPANCTVSGGATRTADVPSGGTATVSFSVSCTAVATRVVFTQQPPGVQPLLSTFTVRVAAVDANGNVVTTFTGPVTLRLASDASLLGNASLRGTTTVDAVNGVATFSGVRVDQTGIGYRLGATAPGLEGATSAAFTVIL